MVNKVRYSDVRNGSVQIEHLIDKRKKKNRGKKNQNNGMLVYVEIRPAENGEREHIRNYHKPEIQYHIKAVLKRS